MRVWRNNIDKENGIDDGEDDDLKRVTSRIR